MSYSLPKYNFRELPAEVMDEIMRGMAAVRPEPTWGGNRPVGGHA